MQVQWPCKTATLTKQLHSQKVADVNNEQYHSKETDQGFSFLFFSFSTALAIEKIGFENFPSYPYWLLYKAATSHYRASSWDSNPWNPNCQIQISNGCHTCYRYPPELKPSAKWPHGCPLSILQSKSTAFRHHWWQNWGKHDFWHILRVMASMP